MTAVPHAPTLPSPFARGMAFLAYFLLLGAVPTFGTSAVIGLIVAYARRDGSTSLIRSHHRFQIRIFWISLALTVAAMALGASAWLHALQSPLSAPPIHIEPSPDAQAVVFRADEGTAYLQPAAVYSWNYSFGQGLEFDTRARIEGYAAMISMALAGLWSIAAPLWGLVRLASDRPIGHSAS